MRPLSRISRATLVIAALAFSAGFFVAEWRSGPHLATGTAYAAEDQISVEADDFSYAIPIDVMWTDANGTNHHGDRPECLAPNTQPIFDARFAYVDVSVEGSNVRQVVWVDCR